MIKKIITSNILFIGILILVSNVSYNNENILINMILNFISFVLILFSYLELKKYTKKNKIDLFIFNITLFNNIAVYTIFEKIIEFCSNIISFPLILMITTVIFLFVLINLLLLLISVKELNIKD